MRDGRRVAATATPNDPVDVAQLVEAVVCMLTAKASTAEDAEDDIGHPQVSRHHARHGRHHARGHDRDAEHHRRHAERPRTTKPGASR